MSRHTSGVSRSLSFLLVVILLFSAIACSSMKPSAPLSGEQTEIMKQRFGTIGVVSAAFAPRVELQIPAKGSADGASKGALQLPASFIESSAKMGNPYMVVLSVVAAPFLVVAGGVNGALSAEPAVVVTRKEAALKKPLEEMKIQETMRNRFLARASSIQEYNFVDIPGNGPRAAGEHPDYRPLSAQGIKTVHEISVLELSLTGERQIDPDLSLFMQAQARLISTADNTVLFVRTFSCESHKYTFSFWTMQDAGRFREEINRCYADIADIMATKLYVFDTAMREGKGRELTPTGRPR